MIVPPGDLHLKARKRGTLLAALAFAAGLLIGSHAKAGGPVPGGAGGSGPSGEFAGFIFDSSGRLETACEASQVGPWVVDLGDLNGVATEAQQLAGHVLTGAVTETAPGTDTAPSGLNGRLQRIAQRITSLISDNASRWNTLGVKTPAGSAPVVEARLPVFTAFAPAVSLSGTGVNAGLLSVVNAGGSGVVIRIARVKLVNAQTTGITGIQGQFFLRKITGHSGGTALSIGAFDSADVVSGSVTAVTGGTLAGVSTDPVFPAWRISTDELAVSGGTRGELENAQAKVAFEYHPFPGETPVTLRPGEGAAIRQEVTPGANSGKFDVWIAFTQEAA